MGMPPLGWCPDYFTVPLPYSNAHRRNSLSQERVMATGLAVIESFSTHLEQSSILRASYVWNLYWLKQIWNNSNDPFLTQSYPGISCWTGLPGVLLLSCTAWQWGISRQVLGFTITTGNIFAITVQWKIKEFILIMFMGSFVRDQFNWRWFQWPYDAGRKRNLHSLQ